MKQKRLSRKKLLEIAAFRAKRRVSYQSLSILTEVMAKALPGQLVSFVHSSFDGARIVVSRNSMNAPATYANIRTNDGELFNLSTHDFKSRSGKLEARNRGNLPEETLLKIIPVAIKNIDEMTGYTQEVAQNDRKLINVTESTQGYTVTVMQRDSKGRFLPQPQVDRDFPFFNLKFFRELSSKNNGVRVICRAERTLVGG